MNLLVLSPDELKGAGRAEICDARAHHVAAVLRSRVGDRLRTGVLGGRMGHAEVLETAPNRLVVRVSLEVDPPAPLPIAVAVALPRPPVFRRLLTHLSALGIKRIHVFHAERVEKSYWQSPSLAPDAVRAALVDGLAQGMDTIVPDVVWHRRFAKFVTEVLVPLSSEERVLWADPDGAQPCPSAVDGRCTVVVGPEGGFLPREAEHLQSAGLHRVTLGPRVLRTETAVVALVGRLAPPAQGSSIRAVAMPASEGQGRG